MIIGSHVILYGPDAERDRAFLRDVLELSHVDAGGGWLILALPPAEIAVHPTDGATSHEFYLMCDNLDETMRDLAAKGATFGDITEARWGRLTQLNLPSGNHVGLYEPHHPLAIDL